MEDPIAETERLRLRPFRESDAPLILELLNDPGWLRFIGDRNVRSLEDARGYLRKLDEAYARHGFGLYRVERASDGEPLGMCGLVKRDTLDDPDLGFAFLARHRGSGYAEEAARATLRHAARDLGLGRLAAVATPDNERSARLLAKLGFARERMTAWNGNANDRVEIWGMRLAPTARP
jgi:RimJ/RimL family protein N-acetyltransferase